MPSYDNFDYLNLTAGAFQIEFTHIERRAGLIAGSLSEAYGNGRLPIGFAFVNGGEFNAFASRDKAGYQIQLQAAVPTLSIILFNRLLSEPGVLPFLDSTGPAAARYDVPFIIDPLDFRRHADWNVAVTGLRGFAAGTIADMCSTFVLCHEFGHILRGHVEGMEHYFGETSVAELVSNDPAPGDQGLRQAWEYEADQLAASLLIQFIDDLANPELTEPRTRAVFSHPEGYNLEHTLAIAVAVLFAFFTYVQGSRYRLDRYSSHPQPHFRATYLKHFLLQAAQMRQPVDVGRFQSLLEERMSEMMDALEMVGLFEPRRYTHGFMKQLDEEVARFRELSDRHSDSCSAWTWL